MKKTSLHNQIFKVIFSIIIAIGLLMLMVTAGRKNGTAITLTEQSKKENDDTQSFSFEKTEKIHI